MAAQGATGVIYAALGANALIAVTKFFAASVTGSSAMFAEGVHSVVDTGNQGLLLYGLHRAKRPANELHPFGYGKEIYFWAFVVAILIFGLGSGISAYEGVHKLLHPEPIKISWIPYAVLLAAIVFEAYAWWKAFKAFRKSKGDLSYVEAVRRSKDPTLFTVLFEDTAAMLGLIIALIGLIIVNITGNPLYDGLASLGIAIVLAITATFLAIECKGLLMGEAASPQLVRELREKLRQQRGVQRVNQLLTIHFGPNDILVTASVDFDDGLDADEVERTVSRLDQALKEADDTIKRVFIEAQSRRGHLRTAPQDDIDSGHPAAQAPGEQPA